MKRMLFLLMVAFPFLCLASSCSTDNEAEDPIVVTPTVSGTLPVLYVNTEGGAPITSKTVYMNASYWLDPMGKEDVEAMGSQTAPLQMQIRGRGHSSWTGRKKPYKVKLAAKLPVMGMPKNKHWALLAGNDHALTGFALGKIMGFKWTPSLRPVELVLNGDYKGVYFVTETIRIDKNRVNIHEQADRETDVSKISGGWLVEVDNYHDECQITLPECASWNLTLRYHSPEDLSAVQLQWLKDEFTAINKAIYSNDKTSTEWENYFDVESLARFFVLQEVLDNPDGFHGSFYLHKDLGENTKWVAGPIWDLTCMKRQKTDYTFRMKVSYGFTPHWIGELIQYDSFCRAVQKVWDEVYPSRLSEIYNYIDSAQGALREAWLLDAKRWGGNDTWTAEVRAESMKNALRANIEWFNAHLPKSQYAGVAAMQSAAQAASVTVYDMQGRLVGTYADEHQARQLLPKGVYVVGRRKVVVR